MYNNFMAENTVLYRKYRSKSFSEVVGQTKTVEILKGSINKNRVSHAYLFTGPRGTGKTTLARLMAKAVNCEKFNELGDVCNECSNCKAINEYSAIDIIEMDAASNRGIEEIRSLKENVNFSPSFLNKKVYIIDEAHMLTKEAFNALLKTLEEPPAHVMFILATTESHKIPVTILSRVERYDLALASREELFEKLNTVLKSEKMQVEDGVLEIIYKKSGGSFRDAESLLSKLVTTNKDNLITLQEVYTSLGMLKEDDLVNLANFLLARDLPNSLKTYDQFINDGYSSISIIDNLIEKLHEIILSDLKLASSYIPIVNFAITSKTLLKEFIDKNLILRLEIIKYCAESLPNLRSESAGSVTNLPNTPLQSKAIEQIPQVKPDKPLTPSKIQVSNGNYKETIAEFSKTDYPRLRQIILNSQVDLDNDILTIKTPYKLNIAFLNKPEVKTYIIELFKNSGLSIIGVNVESIEDANNSNIEEESIEVEIIHAPIISNVENEIVVEVVKEQTDNTGLVESLL